jgi:gamma-carbonic anhydrase
VALRHPILPLHIFVGCPQVEKGAIVAAGSIVPPGKAIPSGEVWAGNPAKFIRKLEETEADFIIKSANTYSALAAVHAAENAKTFEEILVRPFLYFAGF